MASVPLSRAATAAATVVVSGAIAATAASRYSSEISTTCLNSEVENGDDREDRFKIKSTFLRDIQAKSYLETSSKDDLPSTLRIMTIDLPEMRTDAFEGTCRIAHSGIYVDDVAPPKAVTVEVEEGDAGGTRVISNSSQPILASSNRSETDKVDLFIAQKSLVKSLVHCHSAESRKNPGVSLLEASMEDMNVHRIRKTHQFGSFKHDPGKYYSSVHSTKHLDKVERARSAREGSVHEERETENEVYVETEASFEDEMNAPWNQYSWIEELSLRINGKVTYGAPMERSSRISQALGLGVFRTTVPSSRKWWLPAFLQSNPDGLDSTVRPNCRASNKPHTVIANGAALQLVPSSLRLLQKLCRDANVPLFVIHDPRIWGGNTHHTLSDALREMRRTIKKRIINQALKQQGSSAFARGRLVGQIETNAKWQAKERVRKLGLGERQKVPDWSKFDESRLEKKLVERKVIQKRILSNGQTERSYSYAMENIARKCVAGNESTVTSNSNLEGVVSSAETTGKDSEESTAQT